MISAINKARELSAAASEVKLCLKLIKKHICSYLKFQNYYNCQYTLVISKHKILGQYDFRQKCGHRTLTQN